MYGAATTKLKEALIKSTDYSVPSAVADGHHSSDDISSTCGVELWPSATAEVLNKNYGLIFEQAVVHHLGDLKLHVQF